MQVACLPRELVGGGLVVAGGIFPHSGVFLQEPVTAVLQSTTVAATHRMLHRACVEQPNCMHTMQCGVWQKQQFCRVAAGSRWGAHTTSTASTATRFPAHGNELITKKERALHAHLTHVVPAGNFAGPAAYGCVLHVAWCLAKQAPAGAAAQQHATHQSPESGLQVVLGALGKGCQQYNSSSRHF
jgi:hypothetical protein